MTASYQSTTRRTWSCLGLGLLALLSLTGVPLMGCASLGYDGIRLGQQQREFKHAFPEGSTHRTANGICYMEHDLLGRTEVVVVLLTGDQRAAGKLYATHVQRDYGFRGETTYRLTGELDPELIRLGGTGPIDTLRAIADELTIGDDNTIVRDAHAWVAAGLTRLVQHWPHVGDAGPALTRLTEVLERVPSGGEATITIDPRGRYVVGYSAATSR